MALKLLPSRQRRSEADMQGKAVQQRDSPQTETFQALQEHQRAVPLPTT